jgi:hypothetical protein
LGPGRAGLTGDVRTFIRTDQIFGILLHQARPVNGKKMLKALHQILKPHPYEFYRGDSFQAYLKDPKKSLHIALLCRTVAISLMREQAVSSDVRVSLGIGAVTAPVKKLGSAKGEAFVLSGRSFDELQRTAARLSIVTENPIVNTGLQVLADYINSIYNGMTAKQAEVIFELLTGKTQQRSAVRLKKSKSTVHQLAAAGRWPEIEKVLQQFENLINPLT